MPSDATVGNQNVHRTQAAQNPLQGERRCFACGEKGNFANQSPNPRNRPPQTALPTKAVPIAARQNYVHEKVKLVPPRVRYGAAS
jgi:hypothetical protein